MKKLKGFSEWYCSKDKALTGMGEGYAFDDDVFQRILDGLQSP